MLTVRPLVCFAVVVTLLAGAEPAVPARSDYLKRLSTEQVDSAIDAVLPKARPPKKTLAEVAKENEALIQRTAPPFTTDDLRALMAAPLTAASAPAQPFTSFDGGMSALAPAGDQVIVNRTGEAVGEFYSPDQPSSRHIILFSVPDLVPEPSLHACVARELARIRADFPGASLTEAVPARLGDVEAVTYVMTIEHQGRVERKACTLALSHGRKLYIFLHTRLENFAAAWEDYRRVCESYRVNVPANQK